MAKKPARGEKTQAIVGYLAQNRGAKASEVVAALGEKGIKVSTASVYNLKARKKMGKRRRKAEENGQVVGLSITGLLAAKKLVDTVGGIEPAREALNALAKLS
jgi:uroporphyrinogen-III synthase